MYRLNRSGITVVGFDFDWKKAVLESDIDGFHAMFQEVETVVKRYMANNVDKTHKYAVFGTSFGGVIALYLAKRHTNIEVLILNVTHATVSKVLWNFKPTKPFKKTMVAQGFDTEQKLYSAMEAVEPQTNLHLLRDRIIVNFTDTRDTVVTNGAELAESLKHANPSTMQFYSGQGHFLGATRNILQKSKWDKAFNSELKR